MKTLPIFYDHSSQKSILTFWSAKESRDNGPKSIFNLAEKANLKEIVFVSKNFSTFVEAWKGCKEKNIKLIFGIEIIMCDDARVHTAESRYNEHKIIVFAKNSDGYSDLLKIYSAWHTNPESKYYRDRFDYRQLQELWTKNLHLCIPFFDSFIYINLLKFGSNVMPDLSFCGGNVTIFAEKNTGHPHEQLVSDAIDQYKTISNIPTEQVKTIYYATRADFRAYTVYRAIQSQGSFADPDIEFFCSDEFCFQSWEELNNDSGK